MEVIQMGIYYFDHAASSWPKPPAVSEAVKMCIDECGANPGRGSHAMAVKASRILFDTRKKLAKQFGVKNPNDISYALNTTDALNLAIKGFVKEGDHVICTNIEHNSVRRPLEFLRKYKGVEITYIETDPRGQLNIDQLEAAFRPNTTLVACNHSSNLLGSIVPIEKIAQLCHEHKVKLLVDGAQTAGTVPINVNEMGIDMLAFPGHKGLLGPQGTGGLYIHPELQLEPLFHGGTGSQSEEIEQPTVRPDRYEAGTQNTPGIAGLGEGLQYIAKRTVEDIYRHEWELTQKLMAGLKECENVSILGPDLGQARTGIVSFNIDGADSSEIAFILDQSYQIAVRAGYHCTPLAHQSAGTLHKGAVRASVGAFTTSSDVVHLVDAVKEISQHFQQNK
jgi:cysteine desulfurase family protein